METASAGMEFALSTFELVVAGAGLAIASLVGLVWRRLEARTVRGEAEGASQEGRIRLLEQTHIATTKDVERLIGDQGTVQGIATSTHELLDRTRETVLERLGSLDKEQSRQHLEFRAEIAGRLDDAKKNGEDDRRRLYDKIDETTGILGRRIDGLKDQIIQHLGNPK